MNQKSFSSILEVSYPLRLHRKKVQENLKTLVLKMKDKDFLLWLRNRLIFVYKEHKDTDFVQKLNGIIKNYPEDKDSEWSAISYKELENKNKDVKITSIRHIKKRDKVI